MARPRIIKSPEEAEALADQYFDECKTQDRPITVTGLALALGLNGRQQLMDYENRPEFTDTIKSLKAYVEMGYEERLASGAAAGAIFALKNFGWTDKQEIDQKTHHSGAVERIERVIVDPK